MATSTKKSATKKKTTSRRKQAMPKKAGRKATPQKAAEQATPEAPIEAVAVRIPTDIPKRKPRPQLPTILGTLAVPASSVKTAPEMPSPEQAVNILPDDGSMFTAKRLVGAMLDIWVHAGQCGVHVAETKRRVIFALAAGQGARLEGIGGLFSRVRGMGGHPFGIMILTLPRRGEPFITMRWPYRFEGHVVAGQMWIVTEGDDGEWESHQWGNAKVKAVRWWNAIDAADEE